ncbi:hypothetical protein PRIPAC_96168 [Pristionchus pacificus]|uniref:Uncharacterized protein n=1 Tax=Pristionchus pacificus TaxID=54126 RepID=A0A2A6D1Y0_PRIPA|nr:hypothetical protein PRIPAC_96168 [Pristionchus pacificus]|eukprot:PDM84390.1 hypothetical protein PRIPAC_33413 [Pristionchus pacificus]
MTFKRKVSDNSKPSKRTKYACTADAEEISKESITILDTLKFNKFIFDGKDCDELIPRMFTIVNWSLCEKVHLKWSVSETNKICPLREALLLLPKIKKIKLEFGFSRGTLDARRLRPENSLLEAESLAHIVRNFDKAHLPLVNCHPKDILRSFEICCESNCPDKCIIFSMHHFYAKKFIEYIRERGASEEASATYLLERGTILQVAKIESNKFWTTVVIRKETYRQNQLRL